MKRWKTDQKYEVIITKYKILYQSAKKNDMGACSMKVGWERVLSMLGRNVASSEVAC